jgi:hypothetical protein
MVVEPIGIELTTSSLLITRPKLSNGSESPTTPVFLRLPRKFEAFQPFSVVFSPGLPKIETESHISTPSSRHPQFPFPIQKTAILRQWVVPTQTVVITSTEKIKIKKTKVKMES